MNPRQSVVLGLDVYALLGEIFPEEAGVVIDGGANVGEATRALCRNLPNARVHAFEPVSGPYAELESACTMIGACAHKLALGDARGDAQINVNKNSWTSSLLEANERGHAFHSDWCETVRTESVVVTRLDDWAQEEGIENISILKLDLQGYELPALRGAGALLPSVKAIYSEAQISPEYSGASCFAEIDTFLRSSGFGLYQIADLCLKGGHAEPSCCDGLWLRSDVLEVVRRGAPAQSLASDRDVRSVYMTEAMDACRGEGLRRVALYGAGAHTVACGEALANPGIEICAIIDDRRAGSRLWGLPIVTREESLCLELDAVIVSSDRVESAIYERCGAFRERGCSVVTLYMGGCVRIHEAIEGVEAE